MYVYTDMSMEVQPTDFLENTTDRPPTNRPIDRPMDGQKGAKGSYTDQGQYWS